MTGNPGITFIIYDLREEKFAKLSVPIIGASLKSIREKLKEIEQTAGGSAKELSPFRFEDFEKHYITGYTSYFQHISLFINFL